MYCPFSDGNSCMQYNGMGQFCQDCPLIYPELIRGAHRKIQWFKFHGQIALKCGKESSCTGKVRYSSYTSAVKAAVVMKERKDADLEPYPCPWCYGWHIGRKISSAELQNYAKEM
jgi:hypothetical protein